MRNLLVTLFCISITLTLIAQSPSIDSKAIGKTLKKISNSLYASEHEVTNKEYTGFLAYLESKKLTDKLAIAQIDSTKWREKQNYNEPYVMYYHRHAAYSEYPVVNISYEGATLFCEWLTEQYNLDKARKFEKVKFRLPSKAEWVEAAKGGNPGAVYPWNGTSLQNKRGEFRCNFRRTAKTNYEGNADYDQADITAPARAYWPNAYGLYNMSGNVAEMVAEKGIAKGGSWRDEADKMKIDYPETITYEAPMQTVGFRYFMEVVNP